MIFDITSAGPEKMVCIRYADTGPADRKKKKVPPRSVSKILKGTGPLLFLTGEYGGSDARSVLRFREQLWECGP